MNQVNPVFDQLYKLLNPAQKQAVDTIEGPVMVIAGPGTGKTSILTLRIANILLKTDTKPENILALTFTESGAYNMRKKLVGIIGSAGYKVNIHTFHSFAQEIIHQYPERFPRIIGATPASDIDFFKIIEQAINQVSSDNAHELGDQDSANILRPINDPTYYVKSILSEIKNLKREGYTPDDLLKSIDMEEEQLKGVADLYHEKGAYKGKKKQMYIKAEERIAKNRELAKVFEAYEVLLTKERLYDFEDMILELVKALRDSGDSGDNDGSGQNNLLLILQETYQYILADEHQDANNSQNTILELLSNFHDNPNLFIVGDEKQAIYRFQGASLQNFLYFQRKYPEALLINLENNYRSKQDILDSSHSLIENNLITNSDGIVIKRTRLKSALSTGASKSKAKSITIQEYSSYMHECSGIADLVEELLASGTSPEEIAILYRENSDAGDIAEALAVKNIPYRIESESDLLHHPDVVALIDLMRAVDDPINNHKVGKILFTPSFNVPALDVYKTFEVLYKQNKQKNNVLADILGNNGQLVDGGISAEGSKSLQGIAKFLEEISAFAKNRNCLETFRLLIDRSGIMKSILGAPDSLARFAVVEALFSHIRELSSVRHDYSLHDLIEYFDLIANHQISVKIIPPKVDSAIRLMTAHRSKGLEFDHVIIAHATSGKWGNRRKRNKFNIPLIHGDSSNTDAGANADVDSSDDSALQDERRLFYVAMTRARHSVTITYSLLNSDGKDLISSQFIAEIDPTLVTVIRHEASEYDMAKRQAHILPNSTKAAELKLTDVAYIRQRFLEQGISVTNLNNYIECPWKYFFVNLIHLPELKPNAAMIGTAVHNTLKDFFDKYRIEEDIDKPALLKLFEYYLAREALSKQDFEAALAKWRENISVYYDTYNKVWPRNIINEYSISGVHLACDAGRIDDTSRISDASQILGVDNIILKGKLDKIEILEGGPRVNVVDYKTGAAKSRNEIMGKTKSADGNYYRQLVFYKLLLDLDQRFVMHTGEIDYLVPGKSGRPRKEQFAIANEEVDALKREIIRVSCEIATFTFKDKRCGDADCEYCLLADLL